MLQKSGSFFPFYLVYGLGQGRGPLPLRFADFFFVKTLGAFLSWRG